MGSGVTGQIRCLQNILTQVQFTPQKGPRSQVIRISNQWTGHSIPVTLSAQHKAIFYFKLSTLNSVSIGLGDSEFPSCSVCLIAIYCRISNQHKVKQVSQYCCVPLRTAEQHLEHRLGVLELLVFDQESWNIMSSGKKKIYPRYFCLGEVLYAFNPWMCYFSIFVWNRTEIFEVNLAVSLVLFSVPHLRQQVQTALSSNQTAASEKMHSSTLPKIFQCLTQIQSMKSLQVE